MDERDATIVPEPDDPVRAAILEALAGEDVAPGAWSATALAEGVEDAEPE